MSKSEIAAALTLSIIISASAWATPDRQSPASHDRFGWGCKTQSGEVVLKNMISRPFKVGETVEATSEPYGKGIGVKDQGECSQIRFDMADGRTAICEPIGIPSVHAFAGGWRFTPVDKSKCKAK